MLSDILHHEFFGNWHSLTRALGQASAIAVFAYAYQRSGLRLHWAQFLLLAGFYAAAGFLGARVFSVLNMALNYGEPPQWHLVWLAAAEGSFRWYGSMLLYVAGLPLVLRIFPAAARAGVFDLYALSLCAFIVCAKLGCHLAGDGCYGLPTTLPWGSYYQWGEQPSLLPVHPTAVYDSLFHLLLLAVLLRQQKTANPGQVGLWFFLASSAFCFLLEFIRQNPTAALGLTLAQWTYMAVLGLAFRLRSGRV